MEANLYFMLQTDSVASKLDKTTSYCNPHVNCGSIWVYHDDVIGASPQHRLRPQQSLGCNRNANSQMTLYSVEQQDVLLTCSPQDVSQIDEIEAQLLLAVPIAERQRLVTETTLLQEGRQIFQRWSDQFRPSHLNSTSDIYVYVLGQKDLPEKAAGVIQYVGPLPSFSGTWFGVKLAPRYHGLGTTDGFFRGKQFFHCPADSGVFVAVNRICLCSDYLDFDETYDVVQHQGRPIPLAVADRNGDAKGVSCCGAADEDLPRPPLHVGERVVWISDYGPEPGTVKWIGVLPDCRVKEYTIGVEFDRPIGTGTGKYNNDQLFRTAQNHASLIPVLGLMKAEEFYGSKEAVPPSPFTAGSNMTKRYGTTVKTSAAHTGQEYSSRHDTPSPHGPKLDHVSTVCSKGKDMKSISDIDQASDTLCQSDEELRPCYTKQYSKTMPRSAKSTTTSSSDTTSLLTMSSRMSDQATKGPPPVPLEKLSQETEKSIYDKEPEHYYENVEKDATGRLLNRDTNAFRMIDGSGGERLTSVRSNSGEDVSVVRANRTEDSSNVAIYRSSRSVDNIFSDEKVLQTKDEQFTVQLPYRTGRSVFYERLEKVSSLPNGKPSKEKHNQTSSSSKKPELTKANCDNQDAPDLTQKLSVFVSPGSSPSHGSCDTNSAPCPAKTTLRQSSRPFNSSFDSQKDIYASDRKTPTSVRGAELYSLPAKIEHHYKADNGMSAGGVSGLLMTGGSAGMGGPVQRTVGAQGAPSLPRSGGPPYGIGGSTGVGTMSQEEMLIPKSLSKAELDTDLEIGSMVEVEIGGSVHYGVMRWIGFLKDRNKPLVGVELEEELNSATDGRLGRTRLFDCPPKKGFFVSLGSVRKDSRFEESLQFVNRNASQMFGSMECIDIAGCLPPLVMSSLTSSHVGLNKGIQGHHNSCYMDATLFSMFAFTTVFDSVLFRPKQPGDIAQYDDIQLALREGIVNPLRSNFYVRADKVLRLRTLLDHCSTVQGLMGEEKDPEEFLSSLLQQTLRADPFIHLSSGQESYLFQLFISEKDDNILLPTTQQLLELSFLQSDIKLSEIPSCLILQMPRFGKDYKMFRRIVPSLYLDITDILQFGIRECTICGSLATNECKNCYQQSGDGIDKIAFCDICLGKSHKNPKRSKHQPTKIELNEGFTRFIKEHRSDGDLSLESQREKMELFAVVCIQTSHYVAFVKCGPGPNAPWVFFDSMADRKGEQHGYNIPCIEPCAFLPQLLQDTSYSTIHKYRDEKDIPDQMRRLLCDGYMCLYQTTSLLQYR